MFSRSKEAGENNGEGPSNAGVSPPPRRPLAWIVGGSVLTMIILAALITFWDTGDWRQQANAICEDLRNNSPRLDFDNDDFDTVMEKVDEWARLNREAADDLADLDVPEEYRGEVDQLAEELRSMASARTLAKGWKTSRRWGALTIWLRNCA